MFRISELKPEHYSQIVEVWKDAGLPFKPHGRDSFEEIRRQMERNPDLFIGVFIGEELVGVCIGTEDGRKGWINRIAVKKKWQRHGLASRLIAEMERRLKAKGLKIFCVLVEDWNQPSLALFQKEGYVLHKDIYYLSKRESQDV
ncbi:MAG: GNAT family N-acetyltransferase [Thermoplasmata archaeon]|nr:GNAT family N-acetyltransferase [Thermoplasmata archaeon]